jgi:sulfate adenylyltransferase
VPRPACYKKFTGVDEPYEAPKNPEVLVDTTYVTAVPDARQILLYLEKEDYTEKL